MFTLISSIVLVAVLVGMFATGNKLDQIERETGKFIPYHFTASMALFGTAFTALTASICYDFFDAGAGAFYIVLWIPSSLVLGIIWIKLQDKYGGRRKRCNPDRVDCIIDRSGARKR